MTLLDHCANTLEEITLNIPRSEEVLTADGGPSTHTSRVQDSINMIPSLSNLRRICWSTEYQVGDVLAIAAKQLCSVPSPCNITEVQLCAWSWADVDLEKAKDHLKIIDKVLTGDNFPLLSRVKLPERISFDNFPILRSRGLLESSK